MSTPKPDLTIGFCDPSDSNFMAVAQKLIDAKVMDSKDHSAMDNASETETIKAQK